MSLELVLVSAIITFFQILLKTATYKYKQGIVQMSCATFIYTDGSGHALRRTTYVSLSEQANYVESSS